MPEPIRSWLLVRRPKGLPTADDFRLVETAQPLLADGEVQLRVLLIALNPAIRGWMDAGGNYMAPITLGTPVRSVVLGQVVETRCTTLAAGTIVTGLGSWSSDIIAPGKMFRAIANPLGLPLPAFLHPLGGVGLTAHYGLFGKAGIQAGDAVLVSAAASGVGSLVGQMAKIAGASRIVGIAGGPAKCSQAIEHFGYDVCIDYRSTPNLAAAIGAALPDGCDVVFENVGGAIFEAALDNLAKNARIALCGMIAGYNDASRPTGPANLVNLLIKTARLEGFLISDAFDTPAETLANIQISQWLADGLLSYRVDVRDGLEDVPALFNLLFSGEHDGKLIVRVADLLPHSSERV